MTGREGETFPGFFYGRRGQPDTDEREVRSSQEEGDGLECRHWEFAAIYGAGRGSCQGGSDGGFVALYRRWRKGRGMHCEGPIPALPVAGLFGRAVCCLKKCKHFSVSFQYVD